MRNFYNEFKNPIVTVLIIFVAVFLYTKLAGPFPFSVNSVTTTKTDLFTAEGQGKETAVPDQATLYLGITAQALTVSQAQNKANETASKIINAIKNEGISEKDIKTTNYSVTPNYGGGDVVPLIYPNGGRERISGYTVSQNFEVKVRPIDKVNKVIDAATANGANLVGGINFTFSDELEKKLEEAARKQAVNAAKQKAQSLASATGIRLGRVLNVIENLGGPIYPLAAREKAVSDTPDTNVTPGENSVMVNVTIFYETY